MKKLIADINPAIIDSARPGDEAGASSPYDGSSSFPAQTASWSLRSAVTKLELGNKLFKAYARTKVAGLIAS
jgi:hypothetical protein